MKVCALLGKDNINDDWFEAGTPRPKLQAQPVQCAPAQLPTKQLLGCSSLPAAAGRSCAGAKGGRRTLIAWPQLGISLSKYFLQHGVREGFMEGFFPNRFISTMGFPLEKDANPGGKFSNRWSNYRVWTDVHVSSGVQHMLLLTQAPWGNGGSSWLGSSLQMDSWEHEGARKDAPTINKLIGLHRFFLLLFTLVPR